MDDAGGVPGDDLLAIGSDGEGSEGCVSGEGLNAGSAFQIPNLQGVITRC